MNAAKLRQRVGVHAFKEFKISSEFLETSRKKNPMKVQCKFTQDSLESRRRLAEASKKPARDSMRSTAPFFRKANIKWVKAVALPLSRHLNRKCKNRRPFQGYQRPIKILGAGQTLPTGSPKQSKLMSRSRSVIRGIKPSPC